MLKIYGSMLCPDCVQCRADLDKAGVGYDYLDFSDKLVYLKEFLKLREENPIFQEVKANGSIGIPCLVDEDGAVFLDWEGFIK